jgi:hypothetical protein
MTNANLFPSMVLQMCAIGEESGSIDHMLGKAADFFESEVDDMVAGISSLMEPIIIVMLGTVIGGIVVAMYLPIFKLGPGGLMLELVAADVECQPCWRCWGLLIGSFLNVVIHRLPVMMEAHGRPTVPNRRAGSARARVQPAAPALALPALRHQIRWYENIPVLSYLVLRGRCSRVPHADRPALPGRRTDHRRPLRIRGPAVHGLTPAGLAWAAFASLLIAAVLHRFRHPAASG